jgi:predicted PurR-regulated permease PerM
MEYQLFNYFANPTDLKALVIMDYIFYRIYSFYKKKEDIPVASAIMFVFVVQFCAILLVGVTMNETGILEKGMKTIREMEKMHTVDGINMAPWIGWGSK